MAGHCHAEHMADAGRRLGVSMVLTFAFVAFEAVVGMRSGSLALLSDAGHNFADAVALALSWYGLSAARRPATARRTYGFHRVAILAALANSVSLVIIALGIFWEAYQRLGKPGEVHGGAMVWTAAAAILINGLISYWLHAGSKHDINIRSAYIHMLGDAVSAVGVVAAGLIISRTGWAAADPIVSLLIGALILYSSWGVLQEAVDVLMEATPAGLDLAAVEGDLLALPGVEGVHDLHVWTLGPGATACSAHVLLASAALPEVQARLRAIEAALADRHGILHSTVQVEVVGHEPQEMACPMAVANGRAGG
jgi:cobalt-zinc-cadmium efflux system protein